MLCAIDQLLCDVPGQPSTKPLNKRVASAGVLDSELRVELTLLNQGSVFLYILTSFAIRRTTSPTSGRLLPGAGPKVVVSCNE